MEVVKSENMKEEITDIDTSSTVKVSSGTECPEQMNIKCHILRNKVGLESMKCEKNIKGEEISHEAETSIKREILDGDYELDLLRYDQVKYIKREDYEIEFDKEYMEFTAAECYVSSNKLHFDHAQYGNEVKTIKQEQNVDKKYSSGIKDNREKQDVVQLCQRNYCIPETVDVTRQTHIKVAREGNVKYFKCLFCDYITNHMGHLKIHFTRKHSEDSEIYQCGNCKYKTKVKYNLTQHCRLQHNETTAWLECHMCDFKTKYKHSLMVHHRLKHSDSVEIFHCDRCDFETKYKNNLVQHHRSKHDDAADIFFCKLCDYKTKSKYYLLVHHRSKHDDAAEFFRCEMCDFKTKLKNSLFQHHKSKHDDAAEIFHCKVCDYKTKRKCRLLEHHRLKHDDSTEVFHCELCDYKTKRKSNLKHHRAKHNDSAEMIKCGNEKEIEK